MLRKALSINLLAVFLLGAAATVQADRPNPDYWPTCSSPQNIAPAQSMGGYPFNSRTAVVWNGKEYAAAWVGQNHYLRFRRFYADGTPDGPIVTVSTLYGATLGPSLLWTGSGYAIAWSAYPPAGSYYQCFLALTDENGALTGSEVQLSSVGTTPTGAAYATSMAMGSNSFAVVWYDTRNSTTTGWDIYATLVNLDGTISGGGTYHDIVISNAAHNQISPAVAWDPSFSYYTIVWEDYQSNAKYQLYSTYLRQDNYTVTPTLIVDPPAGGSYDPSLADTGNGVGLVWQDYRDGNYEIYYALLQGNGSKIGSDIRLTNDTASSQNPRIVWTGAEFGVFWMDNRTGSYNTWFQRVTADGTLLGGNSKVTVTADTEYPDAAFGRYDFLATGAAGPTPASANFAIPWGCSYAYNPPCPSGAIAYGVSTTTATIAWLPVDGSGTDIAYYQVYRDDAPLAKTLNTYYTDMGLTSGTTYKYTIHTVNAAQIESTGCSSTTSSVYVKPSAAVTLTVSKSSPDAVLSWTDSSNMTSYNVYRGTSPQVMQKLGSTSTQTFDDANALTNNNVYFYTVDDPGQ